MTTKWVWKDNGVDNAVMGDGCKCARWWETALYIPGLRERLGGNNMHDAEKEQLRAMHVNADSCTQLSVSHMLGRGRMTEIAAYTKYLGKMENQAFIKTAPCISQEIGDGKKPYDVSRLKKCVQAAWVSVRPEPRKL